MKHSFGVGCSRAVMKTLRSHIVQFLNSIFSILRNLPCAHELLSNRCTIAPLLWAHVKTNIVGGPSSFFPYARKFLKSKRENKSGCCLFFSFFLWELLMLVRYFSLWGIKFWHITIFFAKVEEVNTINYFVFKALYLPYFVMLNFHFLHCKSP